MTDIELISLIKDKSDSSAFVELVNRHSSLFYKVCHSYLPVLQAYGYSPNDILEEINLVFMDAISKFLPEKRVKFSSWLGSFTRYWCLHKITQAKRKIRTTDFDSNSNEIEGKSLNEWESVTGFPLDEKYIKDILSKLPDKRIVKIFDRRYFQDKKEAFTQIAKDLNVCNQTIIKLHKQGLNVIKSKMKKELDIS